MTSKPLVEALGPPEIKVINIKDSLKSQDKLGSFKPNVTLIVFTSWPELILSLGKSLLVYSKFKPSLPCTDSKTMM